MDAVHPLLQGEFGASAVGVDGVEGLVVRNLRLPGEAGQTQGALSGDPGGAEALEPAGIEDVDLQAAVLQRGKVVASNIDPDVVLLLHGVAPAGEVGEAVPLRVVERVDLRRPVIGLDMIAPGGVRAGEVVDLHIMAHHIGIVWVVDVDVAHILHSRESADSIGSHSVDVILRPLFDFDDDHRHDPFALLVVLHRLYQAGQVLKVLFPLPDDAVEILPGVAGLDQVQGREALHRPCERRVLLHLSQLCTAGKTDVTNAVAVDEGDQQGHAHTQSVPAQAVLIGQLHDALRPALSIDLLEERLIHGGLGVGDPPGLDWEGLAVIGQNFRSSGIQQPEPDVKPIGQVSAGTRVGLEGELKTEGVAV